MSRVIGLVFVLAIGSSHAASPDSAVLAVAGRANANPSIAAAGAFVAVTWAATGSRGTDVYLAASSDAGRTFSSPALVSGSAGANVSGEQPPQVVLRPRAGRAPDVVVVWTSKAASGTRLLSARSDDGGRRFSAPVPLPGSDAPGNRGWESVAVTPGGDVVAAWLDHRETVSASSASGGGHHGTDHGAHHGTQDGAVRAQLSKLFFAPLGAGGAARALAGGVCYCCKTSLATDGDGGVYVAWRHVYPGNVRDIAFTMSNDGGKTFAGPIRVSDDRWVLDGCPENGPALAVDAHRRVHIVWPTLVPPANRSGEPTMELFHAMSSDGRRFTARQRIPSGGVARHPQMALGSRGDLVIVWDEPAGGRRRIAMARATDGERGTVSFARRTIDDDSSATYPVVAVTSDGTLVAWTSGSQSNAVIRLTRLMP